jgi:hypothetical protein
MLARQNNVFGAQPNFDSGAKNESVIGLRASFGNYNFFHGLRAPESHSVTSSYIARITRPSPPGLLRLMREGRNKVAF